LWAYLYFFEAEEGSVGELVDVAEVEVVKYICLDRRLSIEHV